MTEPVVPFANTARDFLPIKDAALAAVGRVFDSGRFVGGEAVERFERNFAEFCGSLHCVAVGSGTAALHLALLALGVQPEDGVVTAPTTFIATLEAIRYVGASPVLVDIDDQTGNLDPSELADVGSRAKFVLPVHLLGQPCEMDQVLRRSADAGWRVLEDACQAHGAEYKGRKAGTLASVGCFSFYPTKNLGAAGEGGAIVTDDEAIAEECRSRRDHGQARKYVHEHLGFNYRLDTIQAEVLDLKLKTLDATNSRRRDVCSRYDKEFAELPAIRLLPPVPHTLPVRHLYVVRTSRRDDLAAALAERGVQTAVHYPVPAHLQPAFADLGYKSGDFPLAERWADEVLSLPLFNSITDQEVSTVIGAVKEACAELDRQA